MQVQTKHRTYGQIIKKLVMLSLLIFYGLKHHAQILLTPQVPQSGVSQKQQLWDLSISNAGNANATIVIQLLLTDKSTGTPVLSGESKAITIAPGAKFFKQNNFMPVIYTVLSSNYALDASTNGLLPLGNFDVCYSVFNGDARGNRDAISEECTSILVEPLNPPLLVTPADKDSIDETRPVFNWIPPSPATLFSKLLYEFKLVEVAAGQTPETAIQEQLPIIFKTQLISASLSYPSSVKPLDTSKVYAWQVTALNRSSPVAQSDVWSFKINNNTATLSETTDNTPFYMLKTDLSAGLFNVKGDVLKVMYNNVNNDKTVLLNIYNISKKVRNKLELNSNSIAVHSGQNFISFNLSEISRLSDNGIYLFELTNSANEKWYAQFKYNK